MLSARKSPSSALKVMKSDTVRGPRQTAIEVTGKNDHIPLRKACQKAIQGVQQSGAFVPALLVRSSPWMLVEVDQVEARGFKVEPDMQKPSWSNLSPGEPVWRAEGLPDDGQ